jgi:hypothetical protein
MEATTEAVKDTAEKIAAPVSAAAESVKESVAGITENKSIAMVFFGYLLVAVVVFILAYVLYSFLAKKIVQSESYLLPETKIPILGTEYTKVVGNKIPMSGNGKRQTISFWIYIHDVERYKGLYRHVFHRGEKGANGASPLVFMDKTANKLHIRFDDLNNAKPITMNRPFVDKKTISVPSATGGAAQDIEYTVSNDSDKLPFDLATHGITIDYLPLQRWVHVAVVINEEVNGGSIQAFLDGELVKSVEAGKTLTVEFKDGAGNKRNVSQTYGFQNLNLDKPGDIYIGGSLMESVGPGFSGLVSKITYINHDMNVKDIYNLYLEGPIDNLAAKLGMPAYGVRSPIYKIGS